MYTLNTKGLQEKVTLKNLPTIRQTFFVGSSVIFAGYILGYLVHVGFFLLPLLPAIGLMVSALTGFCPMVFVLQKMPWNKEKTVSVEAEAQKD